MSSGNFFDFKQQITRRRGVPVASTPAAGAGSEEPLSVSQLTGKIARVIKAGMPASVLVKGEVSNYRPNQASGHIYFTLKDADSCIDCVMFKSDATRLKFEPENGMELIAGGRVDVFVVRGKYQLYVSSLQPVGQGPLELAFKQLKAKLEAEGLFAPERKRPLPAFPTRICIVTGPNTAALQDVLKVLRPHRFLRLSIYSVPVQGEGAAERIARGIAAVNAGQESVGGFDVLLLCRGGGSLEDLWSFNEEVVARAIVASKIPVITGIGHEIDTSIADLVADYWAHTPTEAARVLASNWDGARELVNAAGERLHRNARNLLRETRQRIISVYRHEFFRRPLDRVNTLRQLLDDRQKTLRHETRRLTSAFRERIHRLAARLEKQGPAAILVRQKDRVATLANRLAARHPRNAVRLAAARLASDELRLKFAIDGALEAKSQKLEALSRHLNALSPEAVLRRGYSITRRKKDGAIVRSAADVRPGDTVLTRLSSGEIASVVEDGRQPKLFE